MKYIWIQVFNLVQKNDFWSYINDKILKLGNFLLKKKTTFFISSVNSKTPQDYQVKSKSKIFYLGKYTIISYNIG